MRKYLKTFVFIVRVSSKPTMTPTNPSSVFPRQQLDHGQSSPSYKCDSCDIVISFHQLTEKVVSEVSTQSRVLGKKNESKHEKRWIFLHTSVVPLSPRAAQAGNGNDCFLPERALKAANEGRSHGRMALLRLHRALCNA